MIYLSEKVLNPEKFFIERCFTKRKNVYYFVAEEEKDNEFLCVKLWNKFNDKHFELEVVKVFTSGENEEIEAEELISNKKEREIAIHEFFYYLSYEDNPQNIMLFEGIIDFIREYIEDAYFYAEENMLYGEFMELFQLKGKVVEGYYEGNLVLIGVSLVNKSTEDIIKSFDNVNICSNFYVEEEEDVTWMIEAYLESMSEYDIKGKFEKAMFDKQED